MSTTVNQKPMELSTKQLAQLHRTQLRIAVEIKKVCDTHGLEYFLMAGTLLGAIRHKGFIPWDDDMDIGMPRDSYEKFLALGQTEMGPEYFFQTMESDPGYGLSFAKIRLNGTELVEISSAKTTAHNGIFVDVFPLDNVPHEIWKRHLHSYLTSAIKRAVLLRQGYEPWFASSRLKSLVHQSATPLAKLLPISILSSTLNTCMQWFNSKPTEFMTAIGGSYGYRKESIDRRWIGSLPERDFEGTSFRCLAGASDYLANLYGDYMTPPTAEGQRSRHGIIKLAFNADSLN